MPALLFPLFFFTAFAGGLSRIDSAPGFNFAPGYTAWIYGFVLLQSAAFGGVFTGFSVARDYESGFARRLMLGAQRRSGIVVGYLLAALTRAAFTIVVVTVVALVAGMSLDCERDRPGRADPARARGKRGLHAVRDGGGDAATDDAGRAGHADAGVPADVPRAGLGPVRPATGWLKSIASVNPVTALLETSRGFIAGEPEKVGLAFGIAALMIVVLAVWARGGLRSAEHAA